MQAATTTIESPQADRIIANVRPARLSAWRWLTSAMSRRIAKCQEARLAKVQRALRSGLAQID